MCGVAPLAAGVLWRVRIAYPKRLQRNYSSCAALPTPSMRHPSARQSRILGRGLICGVASLALGCAVARKDHVSETPATQLLKARGVAYTEHVYDYVEHGGTTESARQLGVDEHHVVKTLVMEDENAKPLIVLMHGDRQVSTKNLARQIGTKKVAPCKPDVAQRHSGYMVGGTSPFGTRKAMPVYVEQSVLDLAQIYINGGRRGYLVGIAPKVLVELLRAQPVQCAGAE
jgi:Cys-tRNA(Pro) deacylase